MKKVVYLFLGLQFVNSIHGNIEHIIETTAVEDTNFDWEYYIRHNHLAGITNEQEAFDHYLTTGKMRGLDYCQSFTIIIALHLYELRLTDWFIERINTFISNNPQNRYYIKITIPIDTNINYFKPATATEINDAFEHLQSAIIFFKSQSPYHAHLVTEQNTPILFSIFAYIKERLNINADRLQIIFTENRGVDIGGFFMALDQIVKQHVPHDFLIKIHSKIEDGWRNSLVFFLRLKINKYLRKYDCMYASRYHFPDLGFYGFERRVYDLQKIFNLTHIKEFDFAGGTMFVASSKFTEFVSSWDFLTCFNMLNYGHHYYYENGFERLFGCIFEKLKFKTYVP